jgi:hypothetical protein
VGYHTFHTFITCVVPQAMINAPNMRNIQLKGRSDRLRTKEIRISGMT